MSNEIPITAIVLAAGLSERMGQFKPLMPLGDQRVIERVVKLFQDAGIENVIVVAGHHALDVRQAIAPLNVRCVENPDYGHGMFTSVLAGIRALTPQCHAFFIHPVDIPMVRSQTVGRLAAAFEDTPATVVYPTFDGRRGHPPLIHSCLNSQILKWPGTGGLRRFLQCHETECLDLAVTDEGVLMDLDTPEAYRRMLTRLNHEGLPSAKECRVLMEGFQVMPPSIIAHCQAVAVVARRLAEALHAAGVSIDADLVHTAALLHDIARLDRDHARAGARLLESHGFTRLAPIVAAHMDLDVNAEEPIDETQVVYLADKLVSCKCCLNLEQRFATKMETFAQDPCAVAAIIRKRASARRIRDKVERITGLTLDVVTGIAGSFGGEKQ